MKKILIVLILGMCLINFVSADITEDLRNHWRDRGLNESDIDLIVSGSPPQWLIDNQTEEIKNKVIIEEQIIESNQTTSEPEPLSEKDVWAILLIGGGILFCVGLLILMFWSFQNV